MDFEKSFNRLEKIINELENKDLSVEKLVSLFDEANELSEKCKTKKRVILAVAGPPASG